MSKIIAITPRTTLTVEDVEKIAEQGSNMKYLLRRLEYERMSEFIDRKLEESIYYQKRNDFADVCNLLVEIGAPKCQVEICESHRLIDGSHKRLFYYCNGKTNNKDIIRFKLNTRGQVFVSFRRRFIDRNSFEHALDSFNRSVLIDLLKEYPIKCAQWDEENKVIIRIFDKYDKLHRMTETSLRILVENELKNKNCSYSLEVKKARGKLEVTMRPHWKFEISFTNKRLIETVNELSEIINSMKSISDEITDS